MVGQGPAGSRLCTRSNLAGTGTINGTCNIMHAALESIWGPWKCVTCNELLITTDARSFKWELVRSSIVCCVTSLVPAFVSGSIWGVSMSITGASDAGGMDAITQSTRILGAM